MKIGLSYSRCIRDIIDGRVAIEDVLVIIARTDFDPHDDEHWSQIWRGYGGGVEAVGLQQLLSGSNPEWLGYENEQEFRDLTILLHDSGKLHQPRQFGSQVFRSEHYWLDTCLPDSELARFPAVKRAWDDFQMVAGLAGVGLNRNTHEHR